MDLPNTFISRRRRSFERSSEQGSECDVVRYDAPFTLPDEDTGHDAVDVRTDDDTSGADIDDQVSCDGTGELLNLSIDEEVGGEFT